MVSLGASWSRLIVRLAKEGTMGYPWSDPLVLWAAGSRGLRVAQKLLARRESLRNINVGRLRRRTAVVRSDLWAQTRNPKNGAEMAQ